MPQLVEAVACIAAMYITVRFIEAGSIAAPHVGVASTAVQPVRLVLTRSCPAAAAVLHSLLFGANLPRPNLF
jgi:hypothetical protein